MRAFKGGSGFAAVLIGVGSLELYEGGDGDRNKGCTSWRDWAKSMYSFFVWCVSDSKNRTSNPSSLPSAG